MPDWSANVDSLSSGFCQRSGWIGAWLVACAPIEPPIEPPDPTEPDDPTLVLREFDGVAPNGAWVRAEPVVSEFPVEVTPDGLTVRRDTGANQHVVRDGLTFEPGRPWELTATVTVTTDNEGLNSFALLFRTGTAADELISTHSVNLGLNRGPGQTGGVAKFMGFVDGQFSSFGEQPFDTGAPGQDLDLRLLVDRTPDGQTVPGFVTFEVMGPDGPVVTVAEDWSAHAYTPPDGPLGFGFNSHGADWTLRDLTVRWIEP